jgi:hypothetical protein
MCDARAKVCRWRVGTFLSDHEARSDPMDSTGSFRPLSAAALAARAHKRVQGLPRVTDRPPVIASRDPPCPIGGRLCLGQTSANRYSNSAISVENRYPNEAGSAALKSILN